MWILGLDLQVTRLIHGLVLSFPIIYLKEMAHPTLVLKDKLKKDI